MNIARARTWLITASLVITGAIFGFFLIAPSVGYPLTWEQATRLLQIVVPVFIGYVSSATYSLFAKEQVVESALTGNERDFSLLVYGPIGIFCVATVAALVSFGISNSSRAVPGSGMTVDTLGTFLSSGLALLTATTGVVITRIFSKASSDV